MKDPRIWPKENSLKENKHAVRCSFILVNIACFSILRDHTLYYSFKIFYQSQYP